MSQFLRFVSAVPKAVNAGGPKAALPLVGLQLSAGSHEHSDVLDLRKHLQRSSSTADMSFTSMLQFLREIEHRKDIMGSLTAMSSNSNNSSGGAGVFWHQDDVIKAGDYDLAPPVVPDRNIFAIGKNYADHIAEVNRAHAKTAEGSGSSSDGSDKGVITSAADIKWPVIFTKAPQTLVAHGGNVQAHADTTRWLDYEVELAVVLGRTVRDVGSDEEAMAAVFGYTIANDVTAREVQKRHLQWFKGKSLDATCPLGPAIMHPFDAAAGGGSFDPHTLSIQAWVNGDLRQSSTTANLIFRLPHLIRELSRGFTLLPGDVILTGTPDGVGYAMDPPQVLRAGDHMALEIEGLGRLENTVVA